MERIFPNIERLIGHTPLLELSGFEHARNLGSRIIAKLEYLNPAGSVKDRVALAMLKDAESNKLLHKDSVIIEPTSGNTGIALAAIGAARGYKVIVVMPEGFSDERIKFLEAYGAKVILTDAKAGMKGAIQRAQEESERYPHSFIPGQFTNSANPQCHYETTAVELWKDSGGHIDVLISGIGTGGTISGISRYIKEKNKDIKIVGVEPYDSPVLSEGHGGEHKIQGLGAGFIPPTLDANAFDDIVSVREEDAYEAARDVARHDGILPGISSGAALYAATLYAAKKQYKGKNIFVILPDSGSRYLTTDLFGTN